MFIPLRIVFGLWVEILRIKVKEKKRLINLLDEYIPPKKILYEGDLFVRVEKCKVGDIVLFLKDGLFTTGGGYYLIIECGNKTFKGIIDDTNEEMGVHDSFHDAVFYRKKEETE